jgi:hypothetical protein
MQTTPRTLSLKVTPLRAPDLSPDRLVPEVVLPAQLNWGARLDAHTSGPRALMLALLEDAIRCLLAPHGSARLAREAETWIRSEDRTWPMSFTNVCDALGLASGTLRVALLARAPRHTMAVTPSPWKLQLRRGRARTRTIALSQRWAVGQ